MPSMELERLFEELHIAVSDNQFEKCYQEMDQIGNDCVSFHEFKHWWYMQKNGKPKMDQCPRSFLDTIAQKMKTQAYGEWNVESWSI